jgi:hypothetical protein
MADPSTSRTLTLTTGGITLLGVLVSLGVTVAFGIKADWWIRILAGMATTATSGASGGGGEARNVCGPRPAGPPRAVDDRLRRRRALLRRSARGWSSSSRSTPP